MNQITGMLFDVNEETFEQVTINDDLESYYDILNCRLIDIAHRYFGSQEYPLTIVCDDEGLFTESPKVSARDRDLNPQFVGNLFICQENEWGELISLTNKECEYLKGLIGTCYNIDKDTREVFVSDVNYRPYSKEE